MDDVVDIGSSQGLYCVVWLLFTFIVVVFEEILNQLEMNFLYVLAVSYFS